VQRLTLARLQSDVPHPYPIVLEHDLLAHRAQLARGACPSIRTARSSCASQLREHIGGDELQVVEVGQVD
jgi:hypothetical protein